MGISYSQYIDMVKQQWEKQRQDLKLLDLEFSVQHEKLVLLEKEIMCLRESSARCSSVLTSLHDQAITEKTRARSLQLNDMDDDIVIDTAPQKSSLTNMQGSAATFTTGSLESRDNEENVAQHAKSQCVAITKKGTRCCSNAQPGSHYCRKHETTTMSEDNSSNNQQQISLQLETAE